MKRTQQKKKSASPFFGDSTYRNTNQFMPLTFRTCTAAAFSAVVNKDSNCTSTNGGVGASVRVGMMAFPLQSINEGTHTYTGLWSSCYPITSFESQTVIKLPSSGPNPTPLRFMVKVFSSAGCTGNQKEFVVVQGMKSPHAQWKIYPHTANLDIKFYMPIASIPFMDPLDEEFWD